MEQVTTNPHAVSIDLFAAGPSRVATPEYTSDYDSLSPAPLSPYDRSTPPDAGFITPRTPLSVSASPVSPYVNVALQDLIQAGHMLNVAAAVPKADHGNNNNNTNANSILLKKAKPSPVENASVLAHLAVFGFAGVLIRYGLGKVFDNVGHVASAQTALFHDLPANMFGCFFMGWVGCVLKKDISYFSPPLALGLSTGLMGSITTFSSWMVKLVMVMTKGFWLRGIVGLLVGIELSFMSLLVGMHTAQWLRIGLIKYINPNVQPDNFRRRLWIFVLFLALGLGSWTLFLVLAVLEKDDLERRTLWLACVLSPPGVWLRWILSRRNGKGLGASKKLHWFPWGTLAANLIACIVGYTTSVALLAVKNDVSKTSKLFTFALQVGDYQATLWIGAVQLGTLGCLSTVSTFVVEVYNLGKGSGCKPVSKAYTYSLVSIISATLLGIVLFSSVVWARNYDVVL